MFGMKSGSRAAWAVIGRCIFARCLLVAVLALGFTGPGAGVSGRGISTGGSCVEYPTEGAYCSDFGLADRRVFLFDGVGTVAERSADVEESVAGVIRVSQNEATAECISHFIGLLCASWFPPCDEDEHPRLPCKEYCKLVDEEYCLKAFTTARQYGLHNILLNCDTDVAGGLSTETNSLLPDYLAGWEGELAFRESTYEDTALAGSPSVKCLFAGGDSIDTSGACKPLVCVEPLMEGRYPLLVNVSQGRYSDFLVPEDVEYCGNMSSDLDCDRCFSVCETECKMSFLFSEVQYAFLATVQWLPGLLGLPLNIIIVVNEHRKNREKKKEKRVVTGQFICAVFGLLLFLIDGLPVLIIGHDIRCNWHHVYSQYLNHNGTSWCYFAKVKVHLLQALMFTVLWTLYRVYKQLKASLTMKRYTPSRATKAVFFVTSFVLPLLLALGTFSLEHEHISEANNIRYTYSCGPKLKYVSEEVLLYQGPLILAGFGCLGISCSLVHVVKQLSSKASALAGKTAGEKEDVVNKAMRNLAINMMRFAGVNTVLVVLNTVSTILYIPDADRFAEDFRIWTWCVETGIDFRIENATMERETAINDLVNTNISSFAENEDFCGSIAEIAPSFGILFMVQAAQTLPPLAFGLLFGVSACKQLKKSIMKSSKVKPRSDRSSTDTKGGHSFKSRAKKSFAARTTAISSTKSVS